MTRPQRQTFIVGQPVDVYIRAGGGHHKWFHAIVEREEQFAGGYEVEVLLIRCPRAGETIWIRNDRRLIRPVHPAKLSTFSGSNQPKWDL